MFPEGVYCCFTTHCLLHCLPRLYSLKWMIVYTKFHLDWLVSVGYMPIYVPIIMHGLRLFIDKNYNVYNAVYMLSYRYLSLHQVFVHLHLPVSEIAKCIA